MPPRKSQRKDDSSRTPFAACFDGAESLQQRAERKRGPDAIPAYEAAAAKFQEALQLAGAGGGASPAQVVEAHFGLGECLQNWAEAVLDVCGALPDGELSPAKEQEAYTQAAQLFQQAVQAYKQVHVGNPELGMRADAAVNCGNTLASLAELLAGQGQADAASRGLTEAEVCYQAALRQEDDALTWSNLADVLVQHAELCCEQRPGVEAGAQVQALYSQAREAYSHACSLSSSENGDDLPGLLLNWGVALLSMAKHAQDSALALSLLEEAATRLRESASFDRGDVAPHNAFGDVLLARAERLAAGGDLAAASAAATSALQDGYLASLRIRATCPEGLVGVAEAHVQLARLAVGEAAAQHWGEAASAYQVALTRPEGLGKFEDRCDVRYNLACCLARCERVAEARALLHQLQAAGAVTAGDIAQDPDLAPLS